MPIEMRPREKAIQFGIESLSDHELVMLVLRHGNSRQTVSDIATNLLLECRNLSELAELSITDLKKISGIKNAKALEISAILELSKRISKAVAMDTIVVNHPQILAKWCQKEIGHLKQECFLVIYLNAAGKIVHHEIIFKGTLDKSLVHPREIFVGALKSNASSFIAVHNHPAGSLIPSEMDILVTKKLIEIANMVQIPLIDHLIVTSHDYYSIMSHLAKTELD